MRGNQWREEQETAIAGDFAKRVMALLDDARDIAPMVPKNAEVGVRFNMSGLGLGVTLRIRVEVRGVAYEVKRRSEISLGQVNRDRDDLVFGAVNELLTSMVKSMSKEDLDACLAAVRSLDK